MLWWRSFWISCLTSSRFSKMWEIRSPRRKNVKRIKKRKDVKTGTKIRLANFPGAVHAWGRKTKGTVEETTSTANLNYLMISRKKKWRTQTKSSLMTISSSIGTSWRAVSISGTSWSQAAASKTTSLPRWAQSLSSPSSISRASWLRTKNMWTKSWFSMKRKTKRCSTWCTRITSPHRKIKCIKQRATPRISQKISASWRLWVLQCFWHVIQKIQTKLVSWKKFSWIQISRQNARIR